MCSVATCDYIRPAVCVFHQSWTGSPWEKYEQLVIGEKMQSIFAKNGCETPEPVKAQVKGQCDCDIPKTFICEISYQIIFL